MKTFVNRLATLGLSAFLVAPVLAQQTQIEVWHTLTGPNRAQFESLIGQFNNSQSEVRVRVTNFRDQERLEQEAAKAISGNRAKPDLVQLRDNRSPEVVAQHKDVLPLHQLLSRYPIADASWFLEQTTDFVRDSRGRLLAFPLMAEIPVMFYNTDMYRNAKLDVNNPAATWPELQAHLLQLRNDARVRCPYVTSDQVKVHLENLAPINNNFYITPDNGLKGTKNATFNFNTLYVRHMSLMVSWRKSELLIEHTAQSQATAAFAKGNCAVLTASSSALGEILNSNVRFGVAPVPYYAQETKKPGAPFVGGSALWVVDGNGAERQKATAGLLAFFASPVIAAQWHQRTGFMPLTDAAYRAADVSFYNRIPGARSIIDQMSNTEGQKSLGFTARNYPEILALFNQAMDESISGEEPPMSALMKARTRAAELMR